MPLPLQPALPPSRRVGRWHTRVHVAQEACVGRRASQGRHLRGPLGNKTMAVGCVCAGGQGCGAEKQWVMAELWIKARSAGNCFHWHLLSTACCLLKAVMLSDYMGNPN